MAHPRAKPAEVADYDSDEGRIVAGTEVSAKTSSKRAAQEKPSSSTARQERSSRSAAPAVSAGDPKYTSSTPAAASRPVAATVSATKATQSTATASPSKTTSKPVIHRNDSARSTTRSATISGSTPTHPSCTDPNCRTPGCNSGPNTERRYIFASRTSMPPPQYPYQPPYDYTTMPLPSAVQQQYTESLPRPRPHSSYAPSGMPMTIPAAQPVPQAAPSSYYPHPQNSYGQAAVPPSPSSPLTTTYPGFPGHTTAKYSARTGMSAGTANPGSMPPPPIYNPPEMLTHESSRRRRAESRPQEDDTSSESASSDDERRHYRHEGVRRHDVRRIANSPARSKSRHRRPRGDVVEAPRRPTTHKAHTTSELPARRPSRRASSPRPGLDYRATSDHWSENHDYERRSNRKSVDRGDAIFPKHARRPSIASSYGTPPTSVSDNTKYEAIIEGPNGQRRVYLSRDEFDALAEQRERQTRQEQSRLREESDRMAREAIERYQKDMSGGYERQSLTADNVKQANRKSMSHVSGRSQKSGASGSKISRSGGLRIESGGTVLYLEQGIEEIALRADDEGGTRVIINSLTGRESSYRGSKSSSSRHGAPRQAPIQENQYEEAL